MPFKSKAQMKWMFWAEKHGKLKKGTAEKWAKHTKSIKTLPEHVPLSKADRRVLRKHKGR